MHVSGASGPCRCGICGQALSPNGQVSVDRPDCQELYLMPRSMAHANSCPPQPLLCWGRGRQAGTSSARYLLPQHIPSSLLWGPTCVSIAPEVQTTLICTLVFPHICTDPFPHPAIHPGLYRQSCGHSIPLCVSIRVSFLFPPGCVKAGSSGGSAGRRARK